MSSNADGEGSVRPEPPTREPGRPREVGRREALVVSLLAAAANFFILRSGGNSGSAIATGCVFMGVFTYAGMRLISRIRSALRPRVADPNELDPGAAPPHGGWANPTGLQSVMDRIRRAISQIRRT